MDNNIFTNEFVILPIIAWLIAQFIKFVIELTMYKKFDFRRFLGSGGMPSSHTAFVTTLATFIGLKQGWGSIEFAISLAFALIVMYDAAGVRRAAGRQAVVLNKIVDELNESGEIHWNVRLKELIGHTPLEVIVGGVLGVCIALVFYFLI